MSGRVRRRSRRVSSTPACAQCAGPMPERKSATGRPPEYCSRRCQQAAYRSRRAADGVPARAPLSDSMVRGLLHDLLGQAQRLENLLGEPLGGGVDTVDAAVQMARRVERLTAAVVWRARDHRVGWEEVAQALHLHPETARKNYHRAGQHAGPVVEDRRSASARAAHLWDAEPSAPPRKALGQVLRTALEVSGLTQREVARRAGISASVLSRLLAGQRLPQWLLAEKIGNICQADPERVRRAWERAKRSSLPPADLTPPVTRSLSEAEVATLMNGGDVPFQPVFTGVVIPAQAPAVPGVMLPLSPVAGEPPQRSEGTRTPLGAHAVTSNERAALLTAPRAELGFRLYEWRVRAAVTVMEAARVIGTDRSKISRMENGRATFQQDEVRLLCQLYAVPPFETQNMLNDVAVTNQTPWWDQFSDTMAARMRVYLSYENSSNMIRTAEPNLIPGLLQTEGYARAIMENSFGDFEDLPSDERQIALQRVRLRMQRQTDFNTSPQHKKLWAVVPEAEILRWSRRPDIMVPQLDKLVELAENPRYSIFLAQSDQWRRPAFSGPVTIFDLDGYRLSTVAYVEAADGATFQTDPAEVERLRTHVDCLSAYSLPRAATRARLSELRDKLDTEKL